MTLHVDRFVRATIERALEDLSSSAIEFFADQLVEEMIANALSNIATKQCHTKSMINVDEKYRPKSITFENIEQQTNALNHASPRVISKRESMDSLVHTLAQQVYFTSLNQLRW